MELVETVVRTAMLLGIGLLLYRFTRSALAMWAEGAGDSDASAQ